MEAFFIQRLHDILVEDVADLVTSFIVFSDEKLRVVLSVDLSFALIVNEREQMRYWLVLIRIEVVAFVLGNRDLKPEQRKDQAPLKFQRHISMLRVVL